MNDRRRMDVEAYKRCPHHGPYCHGDKCCCADKHPATTLTPAQIAAIQDGAA